LHPQPNWVAMQVLGGILFCVLTGVCDVYGFWLVYRLVCDAKTCEPNGHRAVANPDEATNYDALLARMKLFHIIILLVVSTETGYFLSWLSSIQFDDAQKSDVYVDPNNFQLDPAMIGIWVGWFVFTWWAWIPYDSIEEEDERHSRSKSKSKSKSKSNKEVTHISRTRLSPSFPHTPQHYEKEKRSPSVQSSYEYPGTESPPPLEITSLEITSLENSHGKSGRNEIKHSSSLDESSNDSPSTKSTTQIEIMLISLPKNHSCSLPEMPEIPEPLEVPQNNLIDMNDDTPTSPETPKPIFNPFQ